MASGFASAESGNNEKFEKWDRLVKELQGAINSSELWEFRVSRENDALLSVLLKWALGEILDAQSAAEKIEENLKILKNSGKSKINLKNETKTVSDLVNNLVADCEPIVLEYKKQNNVS